MRKMISLLVVVLLIATLLAGCGPEPVKEDIPRAVRESAVADEVDSVESTDEVEIDTTTEEPVKETSEESDIGITEEDFDDLEAAIEGLDAEDLGGLSE